MKVKTEDFFSVRIVLWKLVRLILVYCMVITIVLWNKPWAHVDKEYYLEVVGEDREIDLHTFH